MTHKLAGNSVNSLAVGVEGKPHVWGSGKYGLLGSIKQKLPVVEPGMLAVNKADQDWVVIDASLGEYHGVVITNDKYTNSPLIPLSYANEMFDEIKLMCIRERVRIHEYMNKYFKFQSHDEPLVSKEKFIEFIKNGLKIEHRDRKVLAGLMADLEYRNSKKINIKEFRDQILGYRLGNGKVFTWGLYNDNRLGRMTYEEKKKKALTKMSLGVISSVFKPMGIDDDNSINSSMSSEASWNNLLARDKHQAEAKDHNPRILQFMSPGPVRFPEGINIKRVSCGLSHTLALCQEGTVFAWGNGDRGCLGLGDMIHRQKPVQIEKTSNFLIFNEIVDIDAGSYHSMALRTGGDMYSWGDGEGGKLGHGDDRGQVLPKEIMRLKGICVSAGASHSAAISRNHELYSWGVGSYGRLGHGGEYNVLYPKAIDVLKQKKIESVSCGVFHTLCIAQNGKVFAFGGGKDGKLGVDAGSEDNIQVPKQVMSLDNDRIVEVMAAPFHSMALSDQGKVFTWGDPKDGKLGLGNQKKITMVPTLLERIRFYHMKTQDITENPLFADYDDTFKRRVGDPLTNKSTQIIQIGCNYYNTVFLTNGGEVYVCGSGDQGQLTIEQDEEGHNKEEEGDESASDISLEVVEEGGGGLGVADGNTPFEETKKLERYEAVLIQTFAGNSHLKVRYVSCGAYHMLAITRDGQPFAWGCNIQGQLGLGVLSCPYVAQPQKIKSLVGTFCKMSACGETHSMILSESGDVYTFGANDFGKLGIHTLYIQDKENKEKEVEIEEKGDLKLELQPRLIRGMADATFIACGPNHSAAICRNEGKVHSYACYTWGHGWNGKLGHGDYDNEYKPKMVHLGVVESNFVLVTCGTSHTLFLDTKGEIWFSGSKNSVGITKYEYEDQIVPIKMETYLGEKIKFIASGNNHNLALTEGGSIYGFGRNTYNKISSFNTEFSYFARVQMEETMTLLACGHNHSAAVNKAGLPYTWGNLANARCGITQSVLNDYMGTQVAATPKDVDYIKTILLLQRKKLDKNKEPEELVETHANQTGEYLKFEIQKKIQNENVGCKESSLINRDEQLFLTFLKLLGSFAFTVQRIHKKQISKQISAENAIISRIYTFPIKIPMLESLKTKLPKVINQNKQLYEALFTALQNHPCYIFNMFKIKRLGSIDDFMNIVKAIYGKVEIYDDTRKIHLLMSLARLIFQAELEYFDVRDILVSIYDSFFHQIFSLIFKNQKCNLEYLKELMIYVLRSIITVEFHETSSLGNTFCYDSTSPEELAIDNTIGILTIIIKRLQKWFHVEKRAKKFGKGQMISNEIVWLIDVVKDAIMIKFKKEEEKRIEAEKMESKFNADVAHERKLNFKRRLNSLFTFLLFEQLCKKLKNLKRIEPFLDRVLGDIKKEDYDVYYNKITELFNIDPLTKELSTKNNLASISNALLKYFKGEPLTFTNKKVEKLSYFLQHESVKPKADIIQKFLGSKSKESFILMSIRDSVKHAEQTYENQLTISLDNIIGIQNLIIDNLENICIPDFVEDPILQIVTELGRIEVDKESINTHMSECINLTLNTKMLLQGKSLVKCHECLCSLNYIYIDPVEFKDATTGTKFWTCENENCKKAKVSNPTQFSKCYVCKQYRNFNNFAKNLPFERYKPKKQHELLQSFEELLYEMPLIPKDAEFIEFVINEIQPSDKKSADMYYRQELLEQFVLKVHDKIPEFEIIQEANAEEDEKEGAPSVGINLGSDENRIQLQKLTKDLVKQMTKNFRHRELHASYIDGIESVMDMIVARERNLYPKLDVYAEKTEQIMACLYSGQGNVIIQKRANDIDEILAGKLGLKDKIPSQPLAKFIKQQYSNEPVSKKRIPLTKFEIGENFKSYAIFTTRYLRQKEILVSIKLHDKRCKPIIKKCSYHFLDNGDQGFKVQLVFEEKYRALICGKGHLLESTIEEFEITKEKISEMRRTKSTKTTTYFGSGEFSIFHFVNFLNQIISRTYRYEQLD